MSNLIFCLSATLPLFLTMLSGVLFRCLGLFDDTFTAKLNKFVFIVALPALLFQDLSSVSFLDVWDSRFVLFCFFVTALSILAAVCISLALRDRSLRGEFVQASYRSSAAILGISLIHNIYGTSGMGPLMIVSSVPLYNVAAVLVLALTKPERQKLDKALIQKTLKDVISNPIILGILAGLLWSALEIPQPVVMQLTVKNLAAVATPLGLMVMGASFDSKKVLEKVIPAVVAGMFKLVFFAAVFLPFAIRLGFHDEKLVAILVMLGSSTTVSCFIMARSMGHEGTLTSGAIMLTTFFSAFTLTGWLFVLRTMGLV